MHSHLAHRQSFSKIGKQTEGIVAHVKAASTALSEAEPPNGAAETPCD
ncbi:MAG: hypothetical protein ACKVOJ_03615 [Sphingomonadaceae bacterium]